MYNLEKSPGMFSDRPGTTPKNLDLVVSPTCLREKKRELLDEECGLVGGVRGTPIISQVWPTPPFCPVADCPRFTEPQWRTIRGQQADRPRPICSAQEH